MGEHVVTHFAILRSKQPALPPSSVGYSVGAAPALILLKRARPFEGSPRRALRRTQRNPKMNRSIQLLMPTLLLSGCLNAPAVQRVAVPARDTSTAEAAYKVSSNGMGRAVSPAVLAMVRPGSAHASRNITASAVVSTHDVDQMPAARGAISLSATLEPLRLKLDWELASLSR